ncbi:MAG: Tol-Pal system beta propeller repeat protein TolB [Candidatus Tectomicrobia bacterium]|uniref:Tol-Pal system beta propeller repeat protein TolB n=1 Tax=Tectimicrobiota bacterium TaxID=2528274 RepID=A0A932CQ78_UNCTE|nr:Tol-Pal system beta propeller repeat protein TolB [Candidatus Tectomicrobia bacterium]
MSIKGNRWIRGVLIGWVGALALGVVGSLLRSPRPEAVEVYLDIAKGGGGKITLALSDFVSRGPAKENLSPEIRSILSQDLKASGFFDLVENEAFVREASAQDQKEGKVHFEEWTRLGANALIGGGYLNSRGDLKVDFQLYDVAQGKVITQKSYRSEPGDLRQQVHRFSDEVVAILTGERGIAQTKITFVGKGTGSKELYITDYDGYNVKRLTHNRSIVLSPAWSSDGQRIGFTLYKGRNPSLYVMDWLTGNQWPLSVYQGLNSSVAWAPDGRKLALVLSRDGGPEIYTMSPDGTNLRRLTHYDGVDSSPTWSPNGRQIAFTSDRSGSPQIYVMDAEGSNARRLTFEGNYNDLATWSPKGDKIAYCTRVGGRFQIAVMNADGSQARRLTALPGDNESPTWAPNGRRIAFSSTQKGTSQVYSINPDGTGLQQLTFLGGGCFEPAWSPWLGGG